MLQVVHVDGEEFSYDEWQPWYGDAVRGITINSDNYSGLTYSAAIDAVAGALGARGLGAKQTTWRLRDWGVSRQRYWGTPIPIVHCDACGVVPVPEKDLPVVLPEDLIPDGSGNPLNKHAAFLNVACPACGRPARRETDTMDTFVDSSWYFMRYCDPRLDDAMVGDGTKYWMPMDQYIGGIEHAILHLLYARFWTKVMRDLKLVAIDEPFTKLLTQGMVLNHVWARTSAQGGVDYFPPDEVTAGHRDAGRCRRHARRRQPCRVPRHAQDGQDREERRRSAGADRPLRRRHGTPLRHVRVAAGADARLEQRRRRGRAPLPEAPVEIRRAPCRHARLRGRACRCARRRTGAAPRDPLGAAPDQLRLRADAIQHRRLGCDEAAQRARVERGRGRRCAPALREGVGILLRVLYPVCPHTTWTLWNELGFTDGSHSSILDAPWPVVDEAALRRDEIELMLQINGKLRGSLTVAADADRAVIEQAALTSPEFYRHSEGRPVKRVVVVPGRLVNVVV